MVWNYPCTLVTIALPGLVVCRHLRLCAWSTGEIHQLDRRRYARHTDFGPGSPASVRGGGNEEQRLVERISKDPTILGLGDLDLRSASLRSRQVSLLLENPTEMALYVVELQFGRTDDRHIMRLVERWDATRKRYGRNRCFAVLVAEQIAPR
jgi:hypothetical protein